MKERQREDVRLSQMGEYIGRMADLVRERFEAPPLAMVVTYGCQQNVSDSERLKGMLREMGLPLPKRRMRPI